MSHRRPIGHVIIRLALCILGPDVENIPLLAWLLNYYFQTYDKYISSENTSDLIVALADIEMYPITQWRRKEC